MKTPKTYTPGDGFDALEKAADTAYLKGLRKAERIVKVRRDALVENSIIQEDGYYDLDDALVAIRAAIREAKS